MFKLLLQYLSSGHKREHSPLTSRAPSAFPRRLSDVSVRLHFSTCPSELAPRRSKCARSKAKDVMAVFRCSAWLNASPRDFCTCRSGFERC